jgi:hypothetical protein
MTAAVLMTAGMVLSGCASGGKGPCEKDLIMQSLSEFKVALETKNIDKLTAAISDDFDHYEWGNKDSMLAFVKDTMDQGDLDEAEVSLELVEIEVEDGTATAYPVGLIAMFGSATIEFKLKKEADGVWRTVSMEMEGV